MLDEALKFDSDIDDDEIIEEVAANIKHNRKIHKKKLPFLAKTNGWMTENNTTI